MTAAVVMLYVIFSVIAKRRDLGPYPDRLHKFFVVKVVTLINLKMCVYNLSLLTSKEQLIAVAIR